MTEISEGIFYDVTEDQYNAIPAMRSSTAVTLIDECPRIAQYEMVTPIDNANLEFGKAAHVLYLEPEKYQERIVVVNAEDWRTNAAKEARGKAKLDGKIPLLPKDFEKLQQMRDGFFKNEAIPQYMQNIKTEVTLVWKDAETGVWCKARPDIVDNDKKFMANFKTQFTVNPNTFARQCGEMGYHQQADWYCQGWKHLTGELIDYVFLAQDKNEPFLSAPFRLGNKSMEIAFGLNRIAIKTYAKCAKNNDWYGYRPVTNQDKDDVITVDVPAWKIYAAEELLHGRAA